jgi:hypothetical protein
MAAAVSAADLAWSSGMSIPSKPEVCRLKVSASKETWNAKGRGGSNIG